MFYKPYLRDAYPNELDHYGVKGMKWGVINEDKLLGRKKKKKNVFEEGRRVVDKAAKDFKKNTSKALKKVDETAKDVRETVDKVREAVPLPTKLDSQEFLKKAVRNTKDFFDAFTIEDETTIHFPVSPTKTKAEKAEEFEKEREMADEVDRNGVKLQDPPPCTTPENLERTNPYNYTRKDEYTTNCPNCAMAFEARQRGYEVQAAPLSGGRTNKETFTLMHEIYPGASPQPLWDIDWDRRPEGWPSNDDELAECYEELNSLLAAAGPDNENLIAKVLDTMANEPPGSRGSILVQWREGGGHAMSYEITENGELRLMCPQTNQVWEGDEVKELLKDVYTFSYVRLDNCRFNSKALMDEGVAI